MDGSEEIGRGTHGRVVIDLPKFSRRLAVKFADESDRASGTESKS